MFLLCICCLWGANGLISSFIDTAKSPLPLFAKEGNGIERSFSLGVFHWQNFLLIQPLAVNKSLNKSPSLAKRGRGDLAELKLTS